MSVPVKQLDSVTLCCVDTRNPAQAVQGMLACMRHCTFGRALFIGPPGTNALDLQAHGIEFHEIEPLRSVEDYSGFMLRELSDHIHTSHALVVQWDGFVVNPAAWRDDFLSVDYIGAPWARKKQARSVGNGGFSLRSKRLMDVLKRMDYRGDEPEDVAICVTLRPRLEQEHGIRFADVDMAADFAVELEPYRRSFGFHSMHNFAHVMTPAELSGWLRDAPANLLSGAHARKLLKSLVTTRQWGLALMLWRRRTELLGLTRDQALLYLRLRLRQAGALFGA